MTESPSAVFILKTQIFELLVHKLRIGHAENFSYHPRKFLITHSRDDIIIKSKEIVDFV